MAAVDAALGIQPGEEEQGPAPHVLAQLLGLTWENIKSRAVKMLGPKVVGMIEKGAAVVSKAIEIYNVIKTEGIAGVWHLIQDKVAEIKAQLRGAKDGGAVGYIDYAGNMDTCIALRTLVVQGDKAYIQAGAGIVADSVPESEYQETLNKARGLLRALEMAEKQL